MVAEFTLFVLFFDFAVVHSGSFGFSARTLFFFSSSSFSCRLSLLLRCLLLLLQDSSFPRLLHRDRPTDRPTVRPLPNRPELPGTPATSRKRLGRRDAKVAAKVGRARVRSGRSDIPRHCPGRSGSAGLLSLSGIERSGGTAPRGELLSSLLRVGEGRREGGMEGGVSRVG